MNSLFKITVSAEPHVLDAVSGALFDAGAGALEESNAGLSVYVTSEEQVAEMQALILSVTRECTGAKEETPVEIQVEPVSSDWQKVWQEALTPEKLTSEVTIRPTHASPAPKGEKTLWFSPETSFGSGGHPTTRLAAEALEHCAKHDGGRVLLDVGTGNGVLSLLYVLLGGQGAVGVDIDEVAVSSARNNAALNHCEQAVEFILGGADTISRTFSLVVSNMNTHILLAEKTALLARLSPSATLILTGLLLEDEAEVIAAFGRDGLSLKTRNRDGEWSLLTFQR